MSVTLEPQVVPLTIDADGVLRVGSSRVTFDTVWSAFESGSTAEEIAVKYPTLILGDIYQVIGYGLSHPAKVAAYLTARRTQRHELQARLEATQPLEGIRQRLMARVVSQE